jgi:hypothetical protein
MALNLDIFSKEYYEQIERQLRSMEKGSLEKAGLLIKTRNDLTVTIDELGKMLILTKIWTARIALLADNIQLNKLAIETLCTLHCSGYQDATDALKQAYIDCHQPEGNKDLIDYLNNAFIRYDVPTPDIN